MKTIGLLGGMSWESTVHYYQLLNRGVKEHLGGLHSAKIVMESVDFHPLEKMLRTGDWSAIEKELVGAGKRIEAGGAELLLICTNTMHKIAPGVEASLDIPLLHIVDAAGETIQQDSLTTVGLLGTRFTMEEPFYKDRLEEKFGLKVVIPETEDRALVNRVIFSELCQGEVLEESRNEYLRIIDSLKQMGSQGIILGCTEISMLVDANSTPVPLYDTTSMHAQKALEYALK
jgi:aspartate racemase